MTVESRLTRALNITFIDARTLATEAKLKLGLLGYPGKAQESQIVEEATRMFQERPDLFRSMCRKQKQDLDFVKMMNDSSDLTASSSCDLSVDKMSVSSGNFKFWPSRRSSAAKPIFKFF